LNIEYNKVPYNDDLSAPFLLKTRTSSNINNWNILIELKNSERRVGIAIQKSFTQDKELSGTNNVSLNKK